MAATDRRPEQQSASAGLGQMGDDLAQAAGSIKEDAQTLIGSAKQDVEERLDRGRSAVAEGLQDFAEAVRHAADELRERDQSPVSNLVSEAANGLQELSRTLGTSRISDMAARARDMGRANPVAFFALTVAAGFAIGRFMRSSGQRTHANSGASANGDHAGRHAGQQAAGSWEDGERPGFSEDDDLPAARDENGSATNYGMSDGIDRPIGDRREGTIHG